MALWKEISMEKIGRYFIRSQYYDSIDDQDLWDNLDGMYEKMEDPFKNLFTE